MIEQEAVNIVAQVLLGNQRKTVQAVVNKN